MRKHTRTRTRTRGKLVLNSTSRMVAYFAYAQSVSRWTGWSFRTISERQALNLVAAGEAEPVTRMVEGQVRTVGYRALKPTSWERPSPATLTVSTMVAVAAGTGGSRLTRREQNEIIKFRVWPLIGDTKAVAVRPRLSEGERRVAMALLTDGRLGGEATRGLRPCA